MKVFWIDIIITRDEWLTLYRDGVHQVLCQDREGKRIKIAARHFFEHVTHEGIRGHFRLETHDDYAFVSLTRVDN